MNIGPAAGISRLMPVAAVLVLAAAQALAQGDSAPGYPGRPVRIVVGLSAGGGTDLIARAIAPKLSEGLGQPFVVDNKPGAATIIATEYVARSPADGYTLLMAPIGTLVWMSYYSKLPYANSDFVPISLIATFPLVLAVGSSTSIRSLKELLEYVKAHPSKANFAATAGFKLQAELFNVQTGTRFEHIGYKGSSEATTAVITGDALVGLLNIDLAYGAVKGRKLRALALTSSKRLAAFADTPTMAELGYPGLEMELWFALVAPAGTPQAIVKRLEREVNRIVNLPEARDRLNAMLVTPGASTSEEMARIIARDTARWAAVAKAANIKPVE